MLRTAEPAKAWDDAPPSSPTKPPPRLARPHFADEHTTKAGRLNVQLLAKLHIRAAALKKKPRQEHRADENQALVREQICEDLYEYWRERHASAVEQQHVRLDLHDMLPWLTYEVP